MSSGGLAIVSGGGEMLKIATTLLLRKKWNYPKEK
jgi:hypothetical protein